MFVKNGLTCLLDVLMLAEDDFLSKFKNADDGDVASFHRFLENNENEFAVGMFVAA